MPFTIYYLPSVTVICCLLLDFPATAQTATLSATGNVGGAAVCNGGGKLPNCQQQTQESSEGGEEGLLLPNDGIEQKTSNSSPEVGLEQEQDEQKEIPTKMVTDFGHMSEQRLRQTIQQIISETINMPSTMDELNRHSNKCIDGGGGVIGGVGGVGENAEEMQLAKNIHQDTPPMPFNLEHYFQPKTYQDLLATAVLNKVPPKSACCHLYPINIYAYISIYILISIS